MVPRWGCAWWVLVVAGIAVAASTGRASEGAINLDLERCVEMALEVNVSVLKAGYLLEQARSDVITSSSALLPGVSISSTQSKYETPYSRVIGDKVITTDRAYSASLNIGETVTFGGWMGVLETVAAKRSSEYYLRQVRQEVAYAAKQKYLEVLRSQRLLAVREEAVDLSRRRLEKAEAMVEVGSAVRSDVLRAQVEVSRNELDLISSRNDLRLAETELRYFLGIENEAPLELADILDTEETGYELDKAISEAMVMRPDIRSVSETLRSVRRSVWRERGGWFPWVDFRWSNLYTADRFPDNLGVLRDEAEWSWQLSLGFDLFDGLETFGRVERAKALRRSAEVDLEEVKREAALETRQAFYNVEEARQRVKVSEETVSLAEEELRLADERYRLGGATMLEQIDAQVALSEARTSHIEALYDYLLSKAQLELAVGKD
jgi:outer membrane protein